MEDLKIFLKQIDAGIDYDKQKAYVFFIVFSRFEYALKNGGYCTKTNTKDTKAKADWDRFGRDLRIIFNEYSSKELDCAVKYIVEGPPKLQTYDNNNLNWEDSNRYENQNQSLIEWLLLMIRRIRNNLFHGGKYPNFPVEEPSRNWELIDNSLIILMSCIDLKENVKDYFYEYI